MTLELARFLKKVTDEFGNQECDIREEYYARGRGNNATVAIEVTSPLVLLHDILQYIQGNVSEDSHWLDSVPEFEFGMFSMDNMGHNVVIY